MSGIKQCGFCSLLGQLLRRVMCIGPRRGSSESYYRELGDQDTLKVDGSQGSEDSVEMHHDTNGASTSNNRQQQRPQAYQAAEPAEPSQVMEPTTPPVFVLEEADILAALELLQSLSIARNCQNYRFHSMQRRQRRALVTRSLVGEEALLDDLLIGQVEFILDHISSWNFNAFTLDCVAGGRGLPMLCVHLFQVYGLIAHFRLDPMKLWKLFMLFEENYHCTNPYHNSIHATDVTQAMHCFLQQEQIMEHMQPIEVMAGLLSAIAHDLDHPGVNQTFLVSTSSHLVSLYQSRSVLENHHWRAAVSCLIESHILEDIPEHRDQLQETMRSLILATDITRQQDYLGQFKTHLDLNTLDMTCAEHRHLVLQIALKCADICNPCRPWDISHSWSLKVCEEFFRQGDEERRLNLTVSPLCDRNENTIPNIQLGFYKYVVTPLITEWHRFLQSDLSEQMLKNLVTNHERWASLAYENQDVTETPNDAIETDEEHDAVNKSGSLEHLLPRRSSLNPARPTNFREQLRRFSAPLNVFQDARPRNRERMMQDIAGALQTDGNDFENEREARTERVTSSENLLPEPSIASATTNDLDVNNVFHDRNWKLIRQPTFPPLEAMSRAHSLTTRASSQDDCVYPRAVKSDSGIRLEENQDNLRAENIVGDRLRDNLTAIQLDLERRRKSMATRSDPTTPRERRFREQREVLPALIARTLSPPLADGQRGRRGSAPAPGSEEQPTSPAANGRVPRGLQPTATTPGPRRGSLPVEVYLYVEGSRRNS